MKDRVIVALGGNAFAPPKKPLSMAGQFRFAREALGWLKPVFSGSAGVVITHGNGPQVGHMLTRVEEALGKAYAIPLEVCVAESEGELGYVLEQSLYNLLAESARTNPESAPRPIASLLTQVVVDADDPAFNSPTKPVGPFYSREQGDELTKKGFAVCEDAGRGFRRVVPSPLPKQIIEVGVIEQLLNAGVLVIAAGGGGIPVVMRNGQLCGVEAVVDKDLASALLGQALDARLMIVLTGVPCAYRNFGTDRQEPIGRINLSTAESLLQEGHFAPGSMRPKIEAAIQFSARAGARTIICDPPSLAAALAGNAGTIIEKMEDGEQRMQ